MNKDPRNPYDSFMLEASAGTGKTYQLSQRFIYLVGSGVDPSQILTLTFTVKAAQEMHTRIINEATLLLLNKEKQKEFESQINKFYVCAKQGKQLDNIRYPRSAFEVSKEILSNVLKASSVMQLPDVVFTNGKILATDLKNTTSNNYTEDLKTDGNFEFRFKADNLKMITGDYTVSASTEAGVSNWVGKEATYWIAMEATTD